MENKIDIKTLIRNLRIIGINGSIWDKTRIRDNNHLMIFVKKTNVSGPILWKQTIKACSADSDFKLLCSSVAALRCKHDKLEVIIRDMMPIQQTNIDLP